MSKIEMDSWKRKAKRIWKTLNEDNLEIKINTSIMGLILFSLTLSAMLGIYKHSAQAEMKKALKEQKKQMEASSGR
jgi:hypothetical protein